MRNIGPECLLKLRSIVDAALKLGQRGSGTGGFWSQLLDLATLATGLGTETGGSMGEIGERGEL
jgi:hypothetical protein